MTFVQRRHLISLAQTGSFRQSAAALFLTQLALSRSNHALELDLGHALFDRIGRHSEFTPFGRHAVAQARGLVLAADDLRNSAGLADAGQEGVLRIGMFSGPGAMLMTPLLLKRAQEPPKWRVEIARADTHLLVLALCERTWDALIIDARSLRPAPDLNAQDFHGMNGAFMVRQGRPLLRRRSGARFDGLLVCPIGSTPLSDEVARLLVQRYGPRAQPSQFVTLKCDVVTSLIEVTRRSDTALLAIRAAAPDLMALTVQPPFAASARFGLATLRRRTLPPRLAIVRARMVQLLVDGPA